MRRWRAGLADRVGDGDAELPAGMDLEAFSAVPGRIAARLRTMPQAKTPAIVDADGNHAPMSGSHAHSHPAYGEQGDDGNHAHNHAHDGDANHHHSHADDSDGGRRAGQPPGPAWWPSRTARPDPRHRVHAARRQGAARPPHRHHRRAVGRPRGGRSDAQRRHGAEVLPRVGRRRRRRPSRTREGDDDADDQKVNYKFPHHKTAGGPANLAACRNGLARLSSPRTSPQATTRA